MGIEIERKFLLRSDGWRHSAPAGTDYKQGYLAVNPNCSVRVRLAADRAWLTVKGRNPSGLARPEYEYPIPADDAEGLLALCQPTIISKTRYKIGLGPHTWEIDEFHGDNAGLLLAEIELGDEHEAFEQPDWLGMEVTDDPRYYNAALSSHPYCQWREDTG
jgi:adenylate cyclase